MRGILRKWRFEVAKKKSDNQELTELIFLNRNKGKELPEAFWKKVPYKFQYGRIIKCVGSIAKGSYCEKKYSKEAIINAIKNRNIGFWGYEKDFQKVHYYVQVEQEKINKINAPKDYDIKKKETKENIEDLKDYRTEEEKNIKSKKENVSLIDLEI